MSDFRQVSDLIVRCECLWQPQSQQSCLVSPKNTLCGSHSKLPPLESGDCQDHGFCSCQDVVKLVKDVHEWSLKSACVLARNYKRFNVSVVVMCHVFLETSGTCACMHIHVHTACTCMYTHVHTACTWMHIHTHTHTYTCCT